MKNILLTIALLLITNHIYAQVESAVKKTPNLIIKYSPVSLVNLVYPSIQFAVEHRFEEKKAIQYEFGGIRTTTPWYFTGGHSTVYRGLLEYRQYKEPLTFNNKNKFQGIGIRFQQRINDEREFLLTVGRYVHRLSLDHVHTSAGVYYTKGYQNIISNKFMIEFGGALGIQYYDISIRDIPNGFERSEIETRDLLLFEPNYLVAPIVFFVLKIGFIAK